MTRDDVLKEFGADEFVRALPIAVAYPVKSIADEIVRLREALAAVEAELAEHKTAFADLLNERSHLRLQIQGVEAERDRYKQQRDQMDQVWREDTKYHDTLLRRAERILAALREPSEAVVKAAVLHYSGDLSDAIRAAVAAAEKEVQP